MNSLLFRRLVLLFALIVPAAIPAAEAPKKVLVVTVTMGFRHSCIPVSEQVLAQLAKESGKFTVDFVRQPEGMPRPPNAPRAGKGGKAGDEAAHQVALKKYETDLKAFEATWHPKIEEVLKKLSPANLRGYDAVIFANTTGDLPLPDKQGFVDWVASGKGFVAVHAGADTFHETGRFKGFAPYTAMLGGAFRTHGPQVTVQCVNQDASHAACATLPKQWTIFDEIYEFKQYDRARVHRLLTLDKHPQNQEPGEFPIAWCRMAGKGRVFYTALGHREDVWDPNYKGSDGRKNPPEVAKQFQQHLLNGILWALGLEKGDAKPQG